MNSISLQIYLNTEKEKGKEEGGRDKFMQ